jgi:L-arabinose isomerase
METDLPKIGLLTLFFDLYLYGGDKLLQETGAFAEKLAEGFGKVSQVVFPGVCKNRWEVDLAVKSFEAGEVDLIVVIFLTYTPSMYVLPALLETRLPVLLYCTQKLPAVTSQLTLKDTDENHGVHGFQDLANILHRAGRPFHFMAGFWQDQSAQTQFSEWCQAARVRHTLKSAAIGLIGYPMENMGDFALDQTAFQTQLGVHIQPLPQQQIAAMAKSVPAPELQAQMDFDRQHFQIQSMLTPEQHEAASRLEWALRRILEENHLLGVASHFMAVGQEGWLDTLPFLAASKLLAEGYSFGGEGDVTSATAVSILQLLAGEVNFTEIFTIDFGGGTVLMSHMGEGNWRMARPGSPVQLRSDLFDMMPLRVNPASIVFTLRPGLATLFNLTTGPAGKLQFIVSEGEIVDAPPLPNLPLVHYKFKPSLPVADFLTRYALSGGSHHQAIAYGSFTTRLQKLALLLDIPCIVI